MAELGEANIGGRMVPAWLLDTPSRVLDGNYGELSATSKDETYESFCSRLDTLISTWPNKHYEVVSLYPPEIWGTGKLQLGWLVKHVEDYVVFTTLTNYDLNQCGWRMVKSRGVWSPLEWINPPLQIGVEYRTTERYQGKPVYIQLVSCGTFPTAGKTKQVTFAESNIQFIVDFKGKNGSSGGFALPAMAYNGVIGQNVYLNVRSTNNGEGIIYLGSDEGLDLTSQACYVWVKYTKTPD